MKIYILIHGNYSEETLELYSSADFAVNSAEELIINVNGIMRKNMPSFYLPKLRKVRGEEIWRSVCDRTYYVTIYAQDTVK